MITQVSKLVGSYCMSSRLMLIMAIVNKGNTNMLSHFGLLDFSTPELVLILAIILLLFGGKKLPELSRSLGESVKELKEASSNASELKNEVKSQVNETKSELSAVPKKVA